MSAQNTSLASNSPTTSRGQQRGSQTGLTRRASVPSVPTLLLDPLSIFGDSPFSLFREMQQELNRSFGQNRRGLTTDASDDLTSAIWAPPVELAYRDGNLVVSAELPGINDADVQVQINDDVLVIQGERRVEREENDGGIRRTERQYGQFYRAIGLPDGADVERATAEFQNGVLHIKIPIAQSQMRQIPVQASETGTSQSASTRSQSGQGQPKTDQSKPSSGEPHAGQKVA